MTTLTVKKMHEDAIIPKYQTKGAAGFDLHSVEDVTIQAGETAMVNIGLSFGIPHGYEGQVRPRSGMAAKHSVTVLNSPGTIDSDYRDSVKVILINHGRTGYVIKKGDRIAQMIISEAKQVDFKEVISLTDTERGFGGFGSTGK